MKNKGFSLFIIMVLLMAGCQRGVLIEIKNSGKKPIQNITVNAGNYSFKIESLERGKSWSHRVNPVGEASAEVIYTGSNGKKIKRSAGYFEKNYSGSIHFIIDSGKIIEVKDRTELPGILF